MDASIPGWECRVARLLSHTVLSDALHTGAVWSVARGLARNVTPYKHYLSNCDQMRGNDLDGRGTLSEEALAAFTKFFLTVCLDQVEFMVRLTQPANCIRGSCGGPKKRPTGALPKRTGNLLQALLYRGEIPRGDVEIVVGIGERQARRVISALLERNILTSESARAPLRLAFPATVEAGGCQACFRKRYRTHDLAHRPGSRVRWEFFRLSSLAKLHLNAGEAALDGSL